MAQTITFDEVSELASSGGSVERALQEIEANLGSQFDPRLGKLFIDLVRSGKMRVYSDPVPET